MSKAVKGVGSMLGFGSSGTVKAQTAAKDYFDISKEAGAAQDQYKPLLQASQANQQAVAPGQQQALAQMALAATGQGPSLAEMQMRSAQDRGFAQQLAAAQSQRAASPALAQRQLLLNMGNANRDLAQQSAIARLQERDQFLNQANQANQSLRQDIGGNMDLATAPKKELQNWEMARVGAINQAQAANAAATNAKRGALMSGLGTAIGAAATGGASLVPAGATVGGFFGKAEGGQVRGPGTSTSDSIPTMLSDEEFVIKASVVKKPGMLELLEKINAGNISPKKAAKEAATYGHILASKKRS